VNHTAEDEITFYVDAVGACLDDLPATLRHELLEDLPEHLAEVRAEAAGSLISRLGTPETYAAELRAAAGAVGGFPDPPPTPDRLADLRATVLRELHRLDTRIGPLLGYPHATEFLLLLRPAWWVLRGYLAAMVLALLLDDSGQPIGLLPRIGGSEVVALLLLGGAVLASVWIGRRPQPLAPWPRYALYSGTVLLALIAVGGFFNADSTARGAHLQDANYVDPYSGVEDVFVYDEQGRLLTGVRLFDQGGSPIRLGYSSCPTSDEGMPEDATYPYCPENAPFRLPAPEGSTAARTPTASATVTASATPTADVTAGPVSSTPAPR
jgi:hypothetical protein